MLSEISPIAVKLFPAISKSFFCILVFSVCLSYFKHTCLSIFDKLREWKIQNYPVLLHSNIYEYTVMLSYFNIYFLPEHNYRGRCLFDSWNISKHALLDGVQVVSLELKGSVSVECTHKLRSLKHLTSSVLSLALGSGSCILYYFPCSPWCRGGIRF